MKVKDTIVYVLTELWCDDVLLNGTGYKTLKRAKEVAKQIKEETGNEVGITCIQIEQEAA